MEKIKSQEEIKGNLLLILRVPLTYLTRKLLKERTDFKPGASGSSL
jgi:hypothetical protein